MLVALTSATQVEDKVPAQNILQFKSTLIQIHAEMSKNHILKDWKEDEAVNLIDR